MLSRKRIILRLNSCMDLIALRAYWDRVAEEKTLPDQRGKLVHCFQATHASVDDPFELGGHRHEEGQRRGLGPPDARNRCRRGCWQPVFHRLPQYSPWHIAMAPWSPPRPEYGHRALRPPLSAARRPVLPDRGGGRTAGVAGESCRALAPNFVRPAARPTEAPARAVRRVF